MQLTDSNFECRIADSNIPVMVDMWAPWCKPCLSLKPTLRQLAKELHGEVVIAELNLEDNPFITEKYSVDRYPMFLFFVDGREVERIVGTQTRESILATLSKITEKEHE
ncbi:MAG TPA: thiol reductase thioredoxin [Planctomycetaceae bacterium]|nr:thiol reductase thioredoxin [Planctomycetaceae bacterium]